MPANPEETKMICNSAERCAIYCPHKVPHVPQFATSCERACQVKGGIPYAHCIPVGYVEPQPDDEECKSTKMVIVCKLCGKEIIIDDGCLVGDIPSICPSGNCHGLMEIFID